MLVALQGAAVRVVCALWSGHAGADAECRCKVLLEGAAVGVACALSSSYRCRVLLEGAAVRVVRAFEPACWCRWRVLLHAAAGCCWSSGVCVVCVCVRARFGVGMLVAVQGAAAGCCFRCCCQSRVCALALAAGAAAWFCC